MLDRGQVAPPIDDRDDVESNASPGSILRTQPESGKPPQPLLFSEGDGFGGGAVTAPCPGLDLDKDDVSAVGGHHIELTVAAAPVSIEDFEADCFEELRGEVFAPGADGLIACHAIRLSTTSDKNRPLTGAFPKPVDEPRLGKETDCYCGSRRSVFSNSSMFTSLKVITRTCFTNRAGRYMSHTQASDIRTSK